MKIKWESAPITILENVFKYLGFRDRYHASQVCFQWYDAFYCPSLWSYLTIDGKVFTKKRKDMFMGPQKDVKHMFFESYLHCFGSKIRGIRFEPFDNYFNLYEFLFMISKYFDDFGTEAMPLLRSFEYAFFCIFDGNVTFGSGGRMLEVLVKTVRKLPSSVRRLELSNLFLSYYDSSMLLNSFCHLKHSLVVLNISNVTKDIRTASYTALLEMVNLERVSVSLLNISEPLIRALCCLPALREVCAIEDEFTQIFTLELMETQCPNELWAALTLTRCLTLEIHQDFSQPMLLLPKQCPFKRVTYRSKLRRLTIEDLMDLQKIFHATLREVYVETSYKTFCELYLPLQGFVSVPLLLQLEK
ncbi:hypothetical protein BOX15_Mlig003238g1 [Macrostomum lignano]|uniref:F-box domain-containing protein n=1 Tax=Macrostomum lignano TaxID=282301 RepID=A0A267EBT2_9PLAT|nr:hypothetical protein BOX15_Mlig003238g1 [Macrostomum lignano]